MASNTEVNKTQTALQTWENVKLFAPVTSVDIQFCWPAAYFLKEIKDKQ